MESGPDSGRFCSTICGHRAFRPQPPPRHDVCDPNAHCHSCSRIIRDASGRAVDDVGPFIVVGAMGQGARELSQMTHDHLRDFFVRATQKNVAVARANGGMFGLVAMVVAAVDVMGILWVSGRAW